MMKKEIISLLKGEQIVVDSATVAQTKKTINKESYHVFDEYLHNIQGVNKKSLAIEVPLFDYSGQYVVYFEDDSYIRVSPSQLINFDDDNSKFYIFFNTFYDEYIFTSQEIDSQKTLKIDKSPNNPKASYLYYSDNTTVEMIDNLVSVNSFKRKTENVYNYYDNDKHIFDFSYVSDLYSGGEIQFNSLKKLIFAPYKQRLNDRFAVTAQKYCVNFLGMDITELVQKKIKVITASNVEKEYSYQDLVVLDREVWLPVDSSDVVSIIIDDNGNQTTIDSYFIGKMIYLSAEFQILDDIVFYYEPFQENTLLKNQTIKKQRAYLVNRNYIVIMEADAKPVYFYTYKNSELNMDLAYSFDGMSINTLIKESQVENPTIFDNWRDFNIGYWRDFKHDKNVINKLPNTIKGTACRNQIPFDIDGYWTATKFYRQQNDFNNVKEDQIDFEKYKVSALYESNETNGCGAYINFKQINANEMLGDKYKDYWQSYAEIVYDKEIFNEDLILLKGLPTFLNRTLPLKDYNDPKSNNCGYMYKILQKKVCEGMYKGGPSFAERIIYSFSNQQMEGSYSVKQIGECGIYTNIQTSLSVLDSMFIPACGGGDNVEKIKPYLLVSGFSPSNFGGSGTQLDPNGKYYLQDETATGNNRVWISEDQNFKIYDASKSGYWYLDSNNDDVYLGDSVYPVGATSSPYNENDGSSLVWYSLGSYISGSSVTFVSSASTEDDDNSGIIVEGEFECSTEECDHFYAIYKYETYANNVTCNAPTLSINESYSMEDITSQIDDDGNYTTDQFTITPGYRITKSSIPCCSQQVTETLEQYTVSPTASPYKKILLAIIQAKPSEASSILSQYTPTNNSVVSICNCSGGSTPCKKCIIIQIGVTNPSNPDLDLTRFTNMGEKYAGYSFRFYQTSGRVTYASGTVGADGTLQGLPPSFHSNYNYNGYMVIELCR